MRKVKKTVIIYPQGTVKKLSQTYSVSERMVRFALNFSSNSDTAVAIREDCLRNYGGKLTEMFI